MLKFKQTLHIDTSDPTQSRFVKKTPSTTLRETPLRS